MKALLSFLLMASVSVCSAAEIKKTIQVSATIAPYCVIAFKDGAMRYVCRGYEGQEKTVSPHTIKTENNVTTITY